MLQSSARLLHLLSLLQSRRFWTGAELAERLEVTPRTLRRDVERLRSLGYPVDATPGVAGGYQLAAGARLPPLQLQDDEALAVSIALRTATGSAVSGIEEAALRALVKLERVLPPRLRDRIHALRAAISPLPRATPLVDVNVLCTLADACNERVQVHFQYPTRHGDATSTTSGATPTATEAPPSTDPAAPSGARSERCVDPVGLVHSSARWYLVAWDHWRADWRTFRVDRICGSIACGARFTPRSLPEDGDLNAYVRRSIARGTHSHQARIRLYASLAQLRPRIPAQAGALSQVDEHCCLLTTAVYSVDWLGGWLTSLCVDFEVEQPEELIDYLRQQHARLGRALQGSDPASASRLP